MVSAKCLPERACHWYPATTNNLARISLNQESARNARWPGKVAVAWRYHIQRFHFLVTGIAGSSRHAVNRWKRASMGIRPGGARQDNTLIIWRTETFGLGGH